MRLLQADKFSSQDEQSPRQGLKRSPRAARDNESENEWRGVWMSTADVAGEAGQPFASRARSAQEAPDKELLESPPNTMIYLTRFGNSNQSSHDGGLLKMSICAISESRVRTWTLDQVHISCPGASCGVSTCQASLKLPSRISVR